MAKKLPCKVRAAVPCGKDGCDSLRFVAMRNRNPEGRPVFRCEKCKKIHFKIVPFPEWFSEVGE